MTVHEDNQGSIQLIKNTAGQISSRTKHIDIKFHFVRQHYQSGDFDLQYCETTNMLADALTKPLPRTTFEGLKMRYMWTTSIQG
jgi:hypothetical protein